MKKSGLFLFFIFLVLTSFSQDQFKKGFIITNSNDTLFGEIREDFFRLQLPKPIIKFKDSSETIKKYKPNKIKGYTILNGRTYISMKVDEGIGFAELRINGPVKLYYLSVFLYNSSGGPVYHKSYYLEKKEGNFIEIPELGFKKELTKHLSNYPELDTLLLKKKMEYSEIENIIKKYNSWYKKVYKK